MMVRYRVTRTRWKYVGSLAVEMSRTRTTLATPIPARNWINWSDRLAMCSGDGRRARRTPPLGMFISHLKDSTPQVDGQSDLRHLFAYDPARTQHLLQFTQAAMRSPGALTPGERELIAAMTSRENQCLF
jgi:hypothetical protein